MSNAQTHVICNKEADIATIKSGVETMGKDISEIKAHLVGNGTPGLITRAAKLEQIASAGIWLAGVVVVAIIGLFVDAIRGSTP